MGTKKCSCRIYEIAKYGTVYCSVPSGEFHAGNSVSLTLNRNEQQFQLHSVSFLSFFIEDLERDEGNTVRQLALPFDVLCWYLRKDQRSLPLLVLPQQLWFA